MKERELIDTIRSFCGAGDPRVIKGIGDDCAVVAGPDGTVWLLTMDTLVESIHFNLDWHPPEKLGRKCVSVNVSDIAAMGGKPRFVLLSLGLPGTFDQIWFERFSASLVSACAEYGCVLIGGDTVKTTESIMISLTVIGETASDRVLYRADAEVDDTIWVDGPLGMAAAGLELCRRNLHLEADETLRPFIEAHLNPDAGLSLGVLLGESGLVNAMMDLSDGIATDLAHICSESGNGALIEAARLPLHPFMQKVCELIGQTSLDLMLSGGEDYGLLFTASPANSERLVQLTRSRGFSIYPVGVMQREPGVRLLLKNDDGRQWTEDISYQGYDHFGK